MCPLSPPSPPLPLPPRRAFAFASVVFPRRLLSRKGGGSEAARIALLGRWDGPGRGGKGLKNRRRSAVRALPSTFARRQSLLWMPLVPWIACQAENTWGACPSSACPSSAPTPCSARSLEAISTPAVPPAGPTASPCAVWSAPLIAPAAAGCRRTAPLSTSLPMSN